MLKIILPETRIFIDKSMIYRSAK